MSRLANKLQGTLLPAVLTPIDADGRVAYGALESYAARIAREPVGGVAVWAHTGRGLYLSDADRAAVLTTWREATHRPVVAGAGVPRSVTAATAAEAADATVEMAVRAAELGADAVMVYPPSALAPPDAAGELTASAADAILRLHEKVAAASGLPLVAFHLHAAAGGYRYPPAIVTDLLAMPAVIGIKLATLDQAIDCQESIRACHGSGKLCITGEDRMFGPSLMWGADTALVGIAAAWVGLSAATLRAWTDRNYGGFVAASRRLDRFAQATFCAPMEGYVQRMLWAAEAEGLLPYDATFDPYGPPLSPAERDAVLSCLATLRNSPGSGIMPAVG